MRARLIQMGAAVACAVSLALGGCGDDEAGGELASVVPPDVPLYAEVVLRPDGDQRDALESLAEQVAGIDDPGAMLIEELDRSLAEVPGDVTFEDDIEPWLGDHGAFFVRSFEGDGMEPDLAAMVEVTDTDAAQDFIEESAAIDPNEFGEERSYRGNAYASSPDDGTAVGLVGETLVVGTEPSFRVAVDAHQGESLAESEEYAQRIEPLGDDALASVYLEPEAAIEAAINAGDVDRDAARLSQSLLGAGLSEPLALSVAASEDSATVDLVAAAEAVDLSAADGALLLGDLPGDAWLALAAADLGPALERWLDQLTNSGVPGSDMIERRIRAETGLDLRHDVARWLGDAAIFVRGTGVPGVAAGLVAETSDPDGPRELVEAIQRLAERDSGLRSAAPPQGADYGFSLGVAGIGAGAEVGVVGDRLVAALATSFQQVLEPDPTLAEDPRFQEAVERLGEDFSPNLFLDIPQAYAIGELSEDADSPEYEAARQYVEKLGSLVAGVRVDGDLLVSRLIVTLAQ